MPSKPSKPKAARPASPRPTVASLAARVAELEARLAALEARPEAKPAPRPAPSAAVTPDVLWSRIMGIHKSKYSAGGAIKISLIKDDLPDIHPDDVDRCLIELQLRKDLVLYTYVAPQMLTDRDREAATYVSGEARHVIYLTR
jgi:hypothetical protein